MTKLIFTIIFYTSVVVLNAQQGNPFDIQDRLKEEIKQNHDNNKNIFDVDRNGGLKVDQEPILSDTVVPVIVENAQSPENSNQTDGNIYIYKGDNPFEVDHVPIRKRKIIVNDNVIDKASTVTSSNGSSIFIFWITFLSLLLLAIVMNTQKGALVKIFKSLTNENILKLNNREEKGGTSGTYNLLYIIFFLNFASFVYLILRQFNKIDVGFINWFYIFISVFALYLTRHISMYILGTFFPVEKESKLYNFTIIVFNLALGVFLIPVNLLLAFGPDGIVSGVMYFALFIVSLFLLLRLLRGFFISIPYLTSNAFHFLLYLCAFEISPILLILKSIS